MADFIDHIIYIKTNEIINDSFKVVNIFFGTKRLLTVYVIKTLGKF